jgi:TolA-binding protein
MKLLAAVLVSVTLSGCAAVGAITSFFPSKWDPNEAAAITDIRQQVRQLDCSDQTKLRQQMTTLQQRVDWLELYSDSRKNEDILKITKLFEITLKGMSDRKEMSKFFCESKVKIMIKESDAIATAAQGRNK